jgi:hypothetical protein
MGLFENRIKSLEEAANKVLNEYAPPSNPFLKSREAEVSTLDDRARQLSLQKGLSSLFGGGSLPTKLGGLSELGKTAMSTVKPFYDMKPYSSSDMESRRTQPGYGISPTATPTGSSGFGGKTSPSYVTPSNVQGRTTPSSFKSYGSEDEFFERMATIRSKQGDLRRERSSLRQTMTGDKTSGTQTPDVQKKIADLRGQEIASREEAQFLRAQRGRERSREMTQKGIEQARRLAGR